MISYAIRFYNFKFKVAKKNQKIYQKCVSIDKCTCLMRMAQTVVYA